MLDVTIMSDISSSPETRSRTSNAFISIHTNTYWILCHKNKFSCMLMKTKLFSALEIQLLEVFPWFTSYQTKPPNPSLTSLFLFLHCLALPSPPPLSPWVSPTALWEESQSQANRLHPPRVGDIHNLYVCVYSTCVHAHTCMTVCVCVCLCTKQRESCG